MDKKLERPPGSKGRRGRARSEPLEDELQQLYAIYGKGEASPRVKKLARDLGEAGAKARQAAKAKKRQTAE